MFLELPDFLQAAEISRLTELSREIRFVDGRASNPSNQTKNNLQADQTHPRFAESVQIVATAFARSAGFKDFAFPRRIAPPLLARYEPGMKYGPHADMAQLHIANATMQSDLSATVFISPPSTYEGGELVIHLGTRPVPIKGPSGSLVVYPSSTVHEVRPVTSGTRLVSITFIESLVADEHRRTQLYELGEVSALEGNNMRWESRVRLETVRQNLFRMWTSS